MHNQVDSASSLQVTHIDYVEIIHANTVVYTRDGIVSRPPLGSPKVRVLNLKTVRQGRFTRGHLWR